MELYFSPLACSLAARIALYEAGLKADFREVALATKALKDGGDFRTINPKGQVPALRFQDGTVLTENSAILQFLADLAPEADLAPKAGTLERARMQAWLSFVGAELHKGIFYLIFNPAVPVEAKAFAREALPAKYAVLDAHLSGREWLVDGFSVADAYLLVTLAWAQAIRFDLSPWPALTAYRDRGMARPAVSRAFGEEMALRAVA